MGRREHEKECFRNFLALIKMAEGELGEELLSTVNVIGQSFLLVREFLVLLSHV